MITDQEHDSVRVKLSNLQYADTPEEKYKIAFSVLVDALCANEELLAIAATGEGWRQGVGCSAVFDGGHYETLIRTYSDELRDILSDKSVSTRLNNTVRGEVYRRLDAIAYDRQTLNEYAAITKAGRLEIYERRDPESNEQIFIGLTEQMPDESVYDYGFIFSRTLNSHRDHAISLYLSLRSFALLRESVFGKVESTVTLNYKESAPVGNIVLRRLLYTDGMFNRKKKRTRVEVLPPMGKYSVYVQHLNDDYLDNTLIHVGTDSDFLLPLNVSRSHFEERFIEAQIDYYFESAPRLLDEVLANPEQIARYEWGAITGRISEIEMHNAPIRDRLNEERKKKYEAALEIEKERDRLKVEKYNTRIDEIAEAIRQRKTISVAYSESEYDSRNPLLDLFRLYGIKLPLRTQGWINTGLAEITESGYRYYSNRRQGNSSVFNDYLYELRDAIDAEPINIKRRQLVQKESA